MIYCISILPPSVNKMYIAKGKHRFKTQEYNAWIIRTMQELRAAPAMDCKYFSCDIKIPWSMKTKGDIDNRGKAIGDIFVKTKKIPDDRYCLDFRIRYVSKTINNKIEVEFEGISGFNA